MNPNIQLKELLIPIILSEMVGTLGEIKDEQGNTVDAIQKLTKVIENVDLNTYLKYDIIDSESIRRRIKRIEFLTGVNWHRGSISENFSKRLKNIIKTSYKEVSESDIFKRKYDISIWDLMTFFPQLRVEGANIMKNIEEEYKIPNALYTVNQVKSISVLSRTFDVNIIKNMCEGDFISWINNREMEFYEMYKGCGEDRERLLYEVTAKLSPEYMNEKQLPFITTMELKNIIRRIMMEEMKNRPSFIHKESHYPFIDRCSQQLNTVTDKFVEIIIRGLVV